MTTYATGNPIGSKAAKDLYDNAENLDLLMNGPADDYPDRFGVLRQSWRGMENDFQQVLQDSGYIFIGDYDADGPLLISNRAEIFTKDGEYWRADAALVLPYTTVNNWAIDQDNFVSIGDAALRLDLANSADQTKGVTLVGRAAASVDSIDALLDTTPVSSQTVLVKGFFTGTIVGGGAFRWNSGRAKADHNGGTVISPTVPWNGALATLSDFLEGVGETTPAGFGCWERLGVSGRVDPIWFGAVGDYDFTIFDGTDNVIPFQHAAEALKAKGGVFQISSGRFMIGDQVEIALPPSAGGFYRVSIEGLGSGASEVVVGGLVGFRLTGGAGDDVHSYQMIKDVGFRAINGIKVNTAIQGDNLANLRMEGLRIENFQYAINLADFLSSEISNCIIRGNRFGLSAAFSDFSRPNAISLKNTYFLANSAYAIILNNPSLFSMFGGSIEGNGLDVAEGANRGGIFMIDPGLEGAVAISSTGVYYENNGGPADFFSTSTGTGGRTSFQFSGNSFARLDPATCATNNIRIDGQSKFSVSLDGNGFKSFLSYTPSAGRKYVVINATSVGDVDIIDGANFYADSVEVPVFPGRFIGRKSSAAAYVRFDGSGGGASITDSYNTLSVTRLGVGTYRFAYAGLLTNAVNTYSWCKTGPGFAYPIAETTASVDFVFTDIAGTPHDVSGCQITVHGA